SLGGKRPARVVPALRRHRSDGRRVAWQGRRAGAAVSRGALGPRLVDHPAQRWEAWHLPAQAPPGASQSPMKLFVVAFVVWFLAITVHVVATGGGPPRSPFTLVPGSG